MIFDAESRKAGWFSDRVFDVRIVGSGPAGITLARSLMRRGREVGLFEGGGRGPGTSNHWNGWTRPLDAWDFLPHPSNPHSGWPIAKSDLDPFAAETDENSRFAS